MWKLIVSTELCHAIFLQTSNQMHLETTPPRFLRAALRPSTDFWWPCEETSWREVWQQLWQNRAVQSSTTSANAKCEFYASVDEEKTSSKNTPRRICWQKQFRTTYNKSHGQTDLHAWEPEERHKYTSAHSRSHTKKKTGKKNWSWRQKFEQHCVFAVFLGHLLLTVCVSFPFLFPNF